MNPMNYFTQYRVSDVYLLEEVRVQRTNLGDLTGHGDLIIGWNPIERRVEVLVKKSRTFVCSIRSATNPMSHIQDLKDEIMKQFKNFVYLFKVFGEISEIAEYMKDMNEDMASRIYRAFLYDIKEVDAASAEDAQKHLDELLASAEWEVVKYGDYRPMLMYHGLYRELN